VKILRKLLSKLNNLLQRIWRWLYRQFKTRYTISVSFDSEWGNADDREYTNVKKVIKQNFKELKFRTHDGRTIHIKGINGLRYRIEEE